MVRGAVIGQFYHNRKNRRENEQEENEKEEVHCILDGFFVLDAVLGIHASPAVVVYWILESGFVLAVIRLKAGTSEPPSAPLSRSPVV